MAKGIRDQVREWIESKDKMETRIDEIEGYLKESGFGLSGGLVDDEGYPLPDVDKIFEIRGLRNELAMLRNDHTEIMKKIEHGLELCFNEDSGDEESNEKEGNYVDDKKEIENSEDNQLESIKENIIVHKPFCRINQVQFGSPAEQAGLKAGDLVIEFGYANEDNHRNFQAIRDVVIANENCDVNVKIERNSNIIDLHLTPKKWAGNGLLGCHLLPL